MFKLRYRTLLIKNTKDVPQNSRFERFSKELHKKSACSCLTDSGHLIDLNPLAKKDGTPAYADIIDPNGQADAYAWNPCNAFTLNDCNNVAVCHEIISGPIFQYIPIGTQDSAEFSYDGDQLQIAYSDTQNAEQFVSLLFLYILIGILVQIFIRKESGKRVIPNHDFWVAVPVYIKNAIIQRGETGSMFGFSVAQHLDQNTGWMLVGAPEAQTNLQPGIIRGGAVYRCSVDTQSCRVIPFDRQGNDQQYNGTTYLDKEDKSYQWFGATVVSSGVNGLALACAPRYKYHSTALDKVEPVGTCYLGRPGSTSFTEYAPCRNSVDTRNDIDQHHKHGKCTAGFSASITSNGNRLLIGAPGPSTGKGKCIMCT
ncbi:ITGA8 [Mytilus edulis]|uniref:ITGA8 n=1 Tax=Mytilus edulis TaxID=6550 RepID=A0A8S3U1F2_MYTED|nr:ITGA8 [Mytilus edulis]